MNNAPDEISHNSRGASILTHFRKKRTPGSGSVYRRKDTGRQVASITNPTTGKRTQRYAWSAREARKTLAEI